MTETPAPAPRSGGLEPGAGRADILRSAMSRATGTRAIHGNRVGLQFEGPDTFDRWIEAIEGAEKFVLFENYILRDDVVQEACQLFDVDEKQVRVEASLYDD